MSGGADERGDDRVSRRPGSTSGPGRPRSLPDEVDESADIVDPTARVVLARFDEGLASAAGRVCDPRIVRQLEKMRDTAMRFDDAALIAAAAAAPPSGMDTMLAGILHTPISVEMARPELVTEPALVRILGALKLIDRELNDYLASGDPVVLARALGPGLQNFYQVLRHCFGYWQLGHPSHPGKIKRLSLCLGVPETPGSPDAYPVLRLLVDGVEGLAGVGDHRYRGFLPAEMLGPDAPLLPAEPARHVPLYTEVGGMGTVAALIHAWGDNYIAWSDFRHFERTYSPPIQPDPLEGSPFGMPQVFDADQYRLEVQRASTERAWETDPWQTARLLDEYLRGHSRALGGRWSLGWVEPHAEAAEMFSVTLWDENSDDRQIVDLPVPPGSPEQRARQMADFLRTTAQTDWPKRAGTSR